MFFWESSRRSKRHPMAVGAGKPGAVLARADTDETTNGDSNKMCVSVCETQQSGLAMASRGLFNK
jgi:hypothetical protein